MRPMFARIACLALALGILAGCYDIPRPECGFACGPAGECPSDYACNSAVNRCQLVGSTPSCAAAVDAGSDAFPDTPDDFTPPTVTGSPEPGAEDVALNTSLAVQFSEEVFGVSGATLGLQTAGVEVPGVVTITGPTSAVFVPDDPLQLGAMYTVRITIGIVDLAGNPLVPPGPWSFTTIDDETPPMIGLKSPAVDATGVGVGAPVIADFDEPVSFVTSSSFTLRDGATLVPATVSYNTGTMRATLTPSTQLAADTTYTVTLTSAIMDLVGNALVATSWSFTTGPDLQPPIVVTRSPAAGATGVPVTAVVTARFDEQVLGVTTSSFTLTPMGGSPITAGVAYATASRTATLTPPLQLAPNTTYTANLTSAIQDAAGNNLAAFGWSFTTGADMAGPRILQIAPSDLETDVPVSSTIVVRFDEPVQNVTTATFTLDSGAIAGTIALSAGDTIATFTPDAPLPADTAITVRLTTAITDGTGNPLPAPFMFLFRTAP